MTRPTRTDNGYDHMAVAFGMAADLLQPAQLRLLAQRFRLQSKRDDYDTAERELWLSFAGAADTLADDKQAGADS
jgi:hypothetical protein